MRVLLADDERTIAITLADDLARHGHRVDVVADGTAALAKLADTTYDVVISDMNMPGATGMDLLDHVKKEALETEVILITGYGTIDSAVDAMRRGAFDYVLKPFHDEEILEKLRKIHTFRRLKSENAELREQVGVEQGLRNLIGRSAAMQRVIDRIRTIADRDARVLVTGESGTGKERVARAIHDTSRRRDGPFVPLACAAIPSQLLEDEIFGHERGAFTDAKDRKAGRFERADPMAEHVPDVLRTYLDHLEETQVVSQSFELRNGFESTIDEFLETVRTGRNVHGHHHEPQEPVKHGAPKLGRNDPCSCGSGKKFKKCHGK